MTRADIEGLIAAAEGASAFTVVGPVTATWVGEPEKLITLARLALAALDAEGLVGKWRTTYDASLHFAADELAAVIQNREGE